VSIAVHNLYAHEFHKLNEREAIRAADQARLINLVTRSHRRGRLTRSARQEKNATKVHHARNLAPL
jgi:hypothetical protein